MVGVERYPRYLLNNHHATRAHLAKSEEIVSFDNNRMAVLPDLVLSVLIGCVSRLLPGSEGDG